MPSDLVDKVSSIDRSNKDIIKYHNFGLANRLFSVLLKTNLICPRNHKTSELVPMTGIQLQSPQKDETIHSLLKKFFAKKISTSQCKQCRHRHDGNNMESARLQAFPRYLLVFLGPLEENSGQLQSPLTKIDSTVDLTEYLDENKEGNEIRYKLSGIISHTENMYTSVVKKRIEGKKGKYWFSFCKTKMEQITEEQALKDYPAQVLFFSLDKSNIK